MRIAFVMQLNDGAAHAYQARHDELWPDLAATLRDHGASNYSIFLHQETYQLFAYVEVEDEARWEAIADTEVCRRWWRHMADVMATNADNSPVTIRLDEVFHLD